MEPPAGEFKRRPPTSETAWRSHKLARRAGTVGRRQRISGMCRAVEDNAVSWTQCYCPNHVGQFGHDSDIRGGPLSTAAAMSVEEITRFEDQLRAYVSQQDSAPAGLASLQKLAVETRTRLLDLDEAEIELELNDSLRLEMRGYILNALRALLQVPDASSEEQARRLAAEALVELEATRHILRDAVDHEPLRTARHVCHPALSRADAVRHVNQWLPALSREQQAELLGVDPRSLARWREETDKPATWRVEMTVELAGIVRHSWTDEGVFRWFLRAHPVLDGRRPIDVLATPPEELEQSDTDWEAQLVAAARGGRAQVAT